VARSEAVVPLDLAYLADLSVDAVPAMEKLPPIERQCVLLVMKNRLDAAGQDELREWNLARTQARPVLEAVPPIDVFSDPRCNDVINRQ